MFRLLYAKYLLNIILEITPIITGMFYILRPGPLGPAHNPCCSTSEQTGQDNPAFTEEEESGSHHIATVADVHDKNCLSPAKPLDLEIVPKAEGINKLFVARAATLKLKDFEPGESSTDVKENN